MRSLLRKPFRALYYSLYGKTGRDVVINNEKYRVSAHIARGVNPVNNEIPYQILRNLVGSADVVFDIGANVGVISVLIAAAMKRGTKIYSFEPVPSTFDMLSDSARVQRGNASVIPFNLAVSNAVGEISFTNNSVHTKNSIARKSEKDSIVVKSTTIDAFCVENKIAPQVLKVDVEGAEFFALEGMVETLKNNSCIVLVEIHRDPLKEFGVNRQRFTSLLNQIGYQLYSESGDKINYEAILDHACVILSKSELDKSLFSVSKS